MKGFLRMKRSHSLRLLATAWVVVLSGVTTLTPYFSTNANAAVSNGVIAFASQRGVTNPTTSTPADIYVINEDGTGLTNLTNNSGDDILPAWSPDGTKLAFTSKRDGDYEIFVGDYNSATRSLSNLVQLTKNTTPDRFPTWTPDGKTMIIMSQRANNGNFELYKLDLTAANPDSTAERLTFTAGIEDCCSSVSPDGTRFVFASLASGDFELYTMSLTDPTHTAVNLSNRPSTTGTPFHGYDGTPTWSSDGKILYRSLRADNSYTSDIYEIDPTTGVSTKVTNKANAKQPAASPDSKKVVYSAGADNQEDIWVLDRATGTRTKVFGANGRDADGDWQPIVTTTPDPTPDPDPDPDPTPDPDPVPTTPGPDLIVESVTMSPASPVSGDKVSFTVTIKNIGDQPTPVGKHHGMLLTIGSFSVWTSWNTTALAPGATRQLVGNTGNNGVTTWTATNGTHNLKVEVDKQNYITEANETNNVYTTTVTVPNIPALTQGQ
ncbi:TPA: hypothetical protein DCF80_01105 [Candidatus Saccharibacteria bacterium]|nr:hypothetical protein [Candidatus Saccharibacteria bacterium]HRK41094.1 CARDB domain-containing protein [Candidatus Saccharibacteria bacterium]